MDFTQKKYDQFCRAIVRSGYTTLTVAELFEKGASLDLNDKLMIIRHDVDILPKYALDLGKILHRHSLKGSFYFRYPYTWNTEVIKAVEDLGHEIGYHYECVDKAQGDLKKAAGIFEEELSVIRKTATIKTAAMHGNSRTPFDNRDVWKEANPKDFGLLGEAYLTADFTKLFYYTDTGRTWEDGKYNLKDVIPSFMKSVQNKPVLKTTDDLIRFMQSATENIYINTHPDRWADNYVYWGGYFIYDWSINFAKLGYKRLHKLKNPR